MSDIQIISQTPLSLGELKTKLDKLKTKEESARVTRVKEYIHDFTKLSKDDVAELKKKLEALGIQRLKERIIVKIIDIHPATIDELKILFAGENVTLKQDDLAKILEVIQGK